MSFTTEDKQWLERVIDIKLGAFDDKLTAMSAAFDDKLTAMSAAFDDKLTAMSAAVDDRMNSLAAEIERVETSLLTEFHKWASPQEARLRTHSAALRAIDLELEGLSDRVNRIERPAA